MSTIDSQMTAERMAREWLATKGLSRRYADTMATYLADCIERHGEAEAMRQVETIGREAVKHTLHGR